MALPEGTKLMLLAPLVRGRKGQHQEVFEAIRKAGQVRVRVEWHGLRSRRRAATRWPQVAHDRSRSSIGSSSAPARGRRLAESIGLAVKQSEGLVVACYLDPASEEQAKAAGNGSEKFWTDRLFSTLYACPNCQISLEEIEPRTFSFNSPYGACPRCEGLGYRVAVRPRAGRARSEPVDRGWSDRAVAEWQGRSWSGA